KFYDKLDIKPLIRAELLKILLDYYRPYIDIFDLKEADKLLLNRPSINYRITLKPGALRPAKRLFSYSRDDTEAIKAYVENMLGKDFI
ncbi:hypothetical protein P152DRAFT_406784, partial [Eremomyces bilateralis CBS 781.70]